MLKHRIFAALTLALLGGCGGNQAPVADFEVDQSQASSGRIQLDAGSCYDNDGRIVSYVWRFGDGTTSNGVTAEHQFSQSGEYTVTLTVTDNEGAEVSQSRTVVVDITNTPPTAFIQVSQQQGIAPFSSDFSATNSVDLEGPIQQYQWSIDGTVVSSEANFSYRFEQPGGYQVALQVTDSAGVTSSTSLLVSAAAATDGFSIEGRVAASVYTDVDGDTNDPNAPRMNNDGVNPEDVQALTNPVILHGYLTEYPTGRSGDALGFASDVNDFYSVYMKEGDIVSLRVVDNEFADFDLFLLDAETFDVLFSSSSFNEYESIRATANGQYIVLVSSVSGASSYLLKVGETSIAPLSQVQGQSADFAPEEVIVKSKVSFAKTRAGRAQMTFSHNNPNRPVLGKLNALNPQTQTELNIQPAGGMQKTIVEKRNPRAAAKLRTLKALKALSQDENIEYAEPNYRVKSLFEPTDPAYAFQWNYPAINLPQAWDVTLGDASVSVAVVDSGIFSSHPELQGQLLPGYDFISDPDIADDGDGLDDDPEDTGNSAVFGASLAWHGTHVAGIVAANANNGAGGTGVAPGIKLMPLRVIGSGGGTTYDVLQAVRYAAGLENDSGRLPDKPVDVINLSLGGDGFTESAQSLYREVVEKGVFVVSAAGNANVGEAMFPASYRGVISVAATDIRGQRAPYSNYGAFIDVAAPGGNMAEDLNEDTYSDGILSSSVQRSAIGNEARSLFLQGTSMAAPHISGVIALMRSVNPDLSPSEFDSLLASGKLTHDRGEEGRDDFYGHGVIDAFLAVQAARELADGGVTAALVADSYSLLFDYLTDRIYVAVSSVGNGNIQVDGVQTSDAWLSASAFEVEASGLGVYEVQIDRSSLADGNYRGLVQFISSTEQVMSLHVTMRVGERLDFGNPGFIYVLLMDAETLNSVGEVQIQGAMGEEAYYRFEGVSPGDYVIAASSDIDNDGFLCHLGEMCGFYPSVTESSNVAVYRDLSGMDFSVGLDASAPSAGASAQAFILDGWPMMIQRLLQP